MPGAVTIRSEQAGDAQAIADLTARAFAPMPYSDGDEPAVVERLRECGKLSLSLVALNDEGRIIGHIALSPGIVSDGSAGWFALGPISVEPEMQRQGIGSALINQAIAFMREHNAAGCVLIGDPGYYSRFGFEIRADLAPPGQSAQFYQILPLAISNPHQIVDFDPAFSG